MVNWSGSDIFQRRWREAAFGVLDRARLVSALARKAGFRPDQPRVPAGNPDGGQWTDEPSWSGDTRAGDQPIIFVSHDRPPPIPKKRPPTIRERNRWSVVVARTLFAGGILAGEVAEWVWEHARDRIIAYQEPPKTLEELRQAMANPKPGYDGHHLNERTPALRDGYDKALVDGPDNMVLIPTYRHWQITGWYATPNPEFGGLSPREFLRGQSWETRRAVGLKALRDFGALKP